MQKAKPASREQKLEYSKHWCQAWINGRVVSRRASGQIKQIMRIYFPSGKSEQPKVPVIRSTGLFTSGKNKFVGVYMKRKATQRLKMMCIIYHNVASKLADMN